MEVIMRIIFRYLCLALAVAMFFSAISCTYNDDPEKEETNEETTTGMEDNTPEEFKYVSAVPKAAKQASAIYTIPEPSSFSDKLTLGTLQGLVANNCDDQILIYSGAYDNYRNYIKNVWKCSFKNTVKNKGVTLANLLEHYKDGVSGYILASPSQTSESGSVAISLAGVLNAIVVTSENENLCKSLGMDCLIDVTSKTDSWLRSSEYWDMLSRSVALEQPLEMAPKLVDYAVMSHAYFSFYSGKNRNEHSDKYSFLDKNGVVFGYNNTLGEYDTVYSFGSLSLQMIPSDHAYNLSTLSGFRLNTIEQKTKEVVGNTTKRVHTVCLVMSDGDNVQWLMNDFTASTKWFGNGKRGDFCMGWGLPATAIDLVAPMNEYLYDKMSENDEFIMQLSGLGYTFPSKWSSAAREQMAEKLAEYMTRTDLHYAEILDDNGMNTTTLSAFTKQEGIDGLFYIDYSNYAGKGGQILWSNDKPTVAARYRLWANTSDGSIEAIAKSINRLSTNPTSEKAYSFIIVHAWSGLSGSNLAEGGNTMDAVAKLLESFDSDVEVVTPSEFMSRIIQNHPS